MLIIDEPIHVLDETRVARRLDTQWRDAIYMCVYSLHKTKTVTALKIRFGNVNAVSSRSFDNGRMTFLVLARRLLFHATECCAVP